MYGRPGPAARGAPLRRRVPSTAETSARISVWSTANDSTARGAAPIRPRPTTDTGPTICIRAEKRFVVRCESRRPSFGGTGFPAAGA